MLERIISHCQFLALPVPTTVVQAQQQIKEAIRDSADCSNLKASVKTKVVDFATAQEKWEKKAVVYEKELAELR